MLSRTVKNEFGKSVVPRIFSICALRPRIGPRRRVLRPHAQCSSGIRKDTSPVRNRTSGIPVTRSGVTTTSPTLPGGSGCPSGSTISTTARSAGGCPPAHALHSVKLVTISDEA